MSKGVLAGHFAATKARFDAHEGPVLVLQDTTEFIYTRDKPEKVGFTKAINSRRDKEGRLLEHTLSGLLMHSSLAVTTSGTPLGLARSNSGHAANSRERQHSSVK